jgi:O-succinylbenzoic acid--CoA ligase
VAVVVPVDASAPPTLGSLREQVKGELPAYTAPREVRIATRIERTALGKVVRGGSRRPT